MLTEKIRNAISTFVSEHPLLHDHRQRPVTYGTAGFRTKGHLLVPVAARVIFIAVLRSWWALEKQAGHCNIGFMITASHNPADDNGFKIIDYNGEMLDPTWEEWCCKAANVATGEELLSVFDACAKCFGVSQPSLVKKVTSTDGCCMHLGRDTRLTGVDIIKVVESALSLTVDINYINHGLVTTPQLHFIVYNVNQRIDKDTRHSLAKEMTVGVNTFYETLLESFEQLMKRVVGVPTARRKIVVDTSNGVGYYGLKNIVEYSRSRESDVLGTYFDFILVNTNVDDPSVLNFECGADYAKQKYTPSVEMQEEGARHDANTHYYCVDGDADRLVAFAHDTVEKKWGLLDGDRIAILYAQLVHYFMDEKARAVLNVGIVQTAYANGASTAYVKDVLRLTSYIGATGVKNLHPIAHACDVGVYFEANGHGTVLVNMAQCRQALAATDPSSATGSVFVEEVAPALRRLTSQHCGDAIGDLLLCEVALAALQLPPVDWLRLYDDYAARLTKVQLQQRVHMVTTADEQQILEPRALQDKINAAVASAVEQMQQQQERVAEDETKEKKKVTARAFVRPSGTEPIVRVYAEASDEKVCQALSQNVESIVLDFLSTPPPASA
ncbi:phosphoacetylglucosamine mutase [Strigomonas culicis]|uniref:Phosphoacetylglucosamine mutase n=1 Tax=Strigomonas culicis TaxID=28005 RepID=S9V8P8_9TRYP|nr:phosphoacetylglucosamine mutase [Strigomonas culicis]|eukprot:EPY37163.1 phosphoacetylglucosamine mutase [Strigomonas culicis]